MIPCTSRTAPPPFPARAAPPPEVVEPELRPLPSIYSADASPTSSTPLVSFLCPPFRFGAIPVKNGARERIPAIAGELRRRWPSPTAAAALGASGPSDRGGRSRLRGPYSPWVRSTVDHGPGPPCRSTTALALRHACFSTGQSQSATWRSISPSAGHSGVLAKRTMWFLNIAEIPFHLKEPSHISPAFSA
jgi:hypothetical protein